LHAAGLPVVIIGGNHDEASAVDRFNALHLLQRHGVKLYLEQTALDIAGVRLHLVSFQVLARFLRQRGAVAPFDFAQTTPNVLVAHGYTVTPGLFSPPEEVNLPDFWVTDPRFDLVCLGHVHQHLQLPGLPKVFYSGSVERRNFGEVNETPGFWIHDLAADGQLTSQSITVESLGVPITPRPMLQYEIEARELSTDALNERVQALLSTEAMRGAMVRIILNNVSAELDRSRIRAQWQRAFRAADGFYLDIEAQTRRVLELMDVKFAAPPVNIGESFQEFLSQQQYESESERAAVMTLGEEVMTAAHEVLLTQEAE
jgi:DNA repair exonuclease SbcCD nuclease subunit